MHRRATTARPDPSPRDKLRPWVELSLTNR